MSFYSKHVFPFFLDYFLDKEIIHKERASLLSEVSGNILEIGFGTGANLPYYPKTVTKIHIVEPNSGMQKYWQKKNPNHRVQIISKGLTAEKIPFDDGTFNSVVSTFTLCSIPNVTGALSEIKRVLKPGGRFFFLEHGSSDDVQLSHWQKKLEPVNLVLADGCHLTRRMDELVKASGLNIQKIDSYKIDYFPPTHSFIYKGNAVK